MSLHFLRRDNYITYNKKILHQNNSFVFSSSKKPPSGFLEEKSAVFAIRGKAYFSCTIMIDFFCNRERISLRQWDIDLSTRRKLLDVWFLNNNKRAQSNLQKSNKFTFHDNYIAVNSTVFDAKLQPSNNVQYEHFYQTYSASRIKGGVYNQNKSYAVI